MIVSLEAKTLLEQILSLGDLQLLYQLLLLNGELLQGPRSLFLVGHLQEMRLLDDIYLELFLQLLHILLQLLSAELGELVLMLRDHEKT